jgi:secreted PhoX family phosphatase
MLDPQNTPNFPWVGDHEPDSDKPAPATPTFEEVLFERRSMLKTVAAAAAAPLFGAAIVKETAQAAEVESNETFFGTSNGIEFDPIRPVRGGSQDFIDVPSNYGVSLIIRWGDPVVPGAPQFDWNSQTAAKQAQQFGYNNDYVGYFPGTDWRSQNSGLGILAINHEYDNPELMFQNYNPANTTREIVDIEIASHGMSMIEVQRMPDAWIYNPNSRFNRRITGETECQITGPAAGDEWMRTSYDTTGTRVRGTLNNCAGGKTPWGTVLTAEENFNQYFGNAGAVTDAAKRTDNARFGIPTGASPRRWEAFHPRFNVGTEPNEVYRFGWIVEIDPYDPTSVPKKRTALGRAKNECATNILARDSRVVVYKGDDERFDYVYKFVTEGRFNPDNRAANMDLLDRGTLYVARFNADGSGIWIPLVFGQGPLTAANGWRNQADVLIRARSAGDAVGATRMDRPEDVEANPVTGKVYVLCTNNTNRGVGTNPGVDPANPRPANRWGHIVEITEAAGDNASLTFRWDMFMVCGDPNVPAHQTFWAGWRGEVSPIGAPDQLVFDNFGNLWIGTDGMDAALGYNDAVYACPAEGPERGRLRMFMAFPNGAECCGPEFTPDNTTMFGAVQHPGEGSTLGAATPAALWPDGRVGPKPSMIAVIKLAGSGSNRIGSR